MTTDTIKFKRGVKSKLNNLSYGEPAYISDEGELYIGTKSGVEKLTSNKEVKELSSQLAHKANLNSVFSMANMGQDVKEAMTGGSVAVVGKNTVLSDNIVDKQITPKKTSFIKLEDDENYKPYDMLQDIEWSKVDYALNDYGDSVKTQYTVGYQNTGLISVYPNCEYELECTNCLVNYFLYDSQGKNGVQTGLGRVYKTITINTGENDYFLGINAKTNDGYIKPLSLKRITQLDIDQIIEIPKLNLNNHKVYNDLNSMNTNIKNINTQLNKFSTIPYSQVKLPFTANTDSRLLLRLLPQKDIGRVEVTNQSVNIFNIEDIINIDSRVSKYDNGIQINATNVGKYGHITVIKQLKPNTTYYFSANSSNGTDYGCGVSIYADTGTDTILLNKGNKNNPSGLFTTTDTGLCNFKFYILANYSAGTIENVTTVFTDILLAESTTSLNYSVYNCFTKVYSDLEQGKEYEDILILNKNDKLDFNGNSCNYFLGLMPKTTTAIYSVNGLLPNERGEVELSHLINKKIAFFGDSNIGNAMTDDIPSLVSKITKANCYNVGFGATRMSVHPQSEWDSFCMHSLADAIVSGDYSKQEANINLHNSFPTRVETLKSIDWANIDCVAICHGANDWTNRSELDSEENKLNYRTFKGGFRYFIDKLYSINPTVKVILITSPYRGVISSSNGLTCDDYTINNKYLMDFIDATFELGKEYKFPVIDIFNNLNINKYNWQRYMSDGAHLDLYGRKLASNIISKELLKYLI